MSNLLENIHPSSFLKSITDEAGINKAQDPGVLDSVIIEDISSIEGDNYKLIVVNHHPKGPYIRVDTDLREQFLTRQTEEGAEEALRQFSLTLLEQTGGQFDIHPFFGAAWGTAHSTVVKDFIAPGPDESLSMFINLSDKDQFDPRLTAQAKEIGTVFTVPSPKSRKFVEYSQAADKASPNQHNRDTAIINGLGNQWDKEFSRYHPKGAAKPVMVLHPKNVNSFIEELCALSSTPITIPKVFLSEAETN